MVKSLRLWDFFQSISEASDVIMWWKDGAAEYVEATVDAERFVYVMTRDGFDYTEWQKDLFTGETVRSLGEKMMAFEPRTTPAV